jgi:hypothetical protein
MNRAATVTEISGFTAHLFGWIDAKIGLTATATADIPRLGGYARTSPGFSHLPIIIIMLLEAWRGNGLTRLAP